MTRRRRSKGLGQGLSALALGSWGWDLGISLQQASKKTDSSLVLAASQSASPDGSDDKSKDPGGTTEVVPSKKPKFTDLLILWTTY